MKGLIAFTFVIYRNQVHDVALRLELQLLLVLDLDPEPLAIEAVLIAQLMSSHREVALVSILVGPAPCVMHAHRIIGGDRPIEKRPLGLPLVLRAKLLKRLDIVPELQD